MHLPVLPLFPGAVGRLMRFQCLLVDGFQREVEKEVFHLARLYVVLFDLGQHLTGVTRTYGSLVVRKLDDGMFGRFSTFKGSVGYINNNFLEWDLLRDPPRAEKLLYLLKLFLNGFLALFEGLNFSAQLFICLRNSSWIAE